MDNNQPIEKQILKVKMLHQIGRYDAAEQECRKLLALAPNVADAHYILGSILLAKSELNNALEHTETAISLLPTFPAYYSLAARIHFVNNKKTKAYELINEAIRLNPTEGNLFLQRGSFEYHQRKWEAAIADAEQALALNPTDIYALNLRALSLGKLNQTEDAKTTLRESLAQNPNNPETLEAMAWVLLKEESAAAAQTYFEEALRLNPERLSAQHGLFLTELSPSKRNMLINLRSFFDVKRTHKAGFKKLIVYSFYAAVLGVIGLFFVPQYAWLLLLPLPIIAYTVIAGILAVTPIFTLVFSTNKNIRPRLSKNSIVQANIFVFMLVLLIASIATAVILKHFALWLFVFWFALLFIPVNILLFLMTNENTKSAILTYTLVYTFFSLALIIATAFFPGIKWYVLMALFLGMSYYVKKVMGIIPLVRKGN